MHKIKLVIFLIALTVIVSIGNAYGQNSNSITVATNKASYNIGDKVVITGSVQQIINENPVTIIVRNPIGNVYEVGQATLLNNIFLHDFVVSDGSQNGVYTINIKYGDQTAETQFMISAGQLQIIPISNNVIKVRGDNTTLIKYGTAEVSTVDNSISISLDTNKITSGSITEEYQIPKEVIDAPGGQLVVREDGNPVACTQTETDVQRILDCPIQAGTKQLMFIGTVVIPEFGPITMSILTIGILASLVIFSRYKIK
jgi:hypothetical protein